MWKVVVVPVQGKIFSLKMQAKNRSNSSSNSDRILNTFSGCHHRFLFLSLYRMVRVFLRNPFNSLSLYLTTCFSKVMAAERNPFYPKYFLSIGDTTIKV